MNVSAPIPVLRIFDEAKAHEFYVEFLGFKVDFQHRFEPGTPLYQQVSLGACVLQLSEHHGDGTPGTLIKIRVDDIDAFHRQVTAKPYKYYRPGVQDMEWGERQMTVGDGFGNKLVFYTPIPKAPA